MTANPNALALRSVTLRGVGSYLKGARLEVRPLTILCGVNGSGKSTWLRMLRMLRKSRRVLPFELRSGEAEYTPTYGRYTNALLRAAESKGERTKLVHYEDNVAYGPPGTIGIECEAVTDVDLGVIRTSPTELCPSTVEQEFLWRGTIAKGTRLCVKVAHPQKAYADDEGEELFDFVELRIGAATIRFRKPVDVKTTGSPPTVRTGRYELACSNAYLGIRESGETVLGRVEPESEPTPTLDPNEHGAFCGAAVQRIRQLFSASLGGFFYISAIRTPFASLKTIDERKVKTAAKERYVGMRGQMAIALEEQFAYNAMHAPGSPNDRFPFEAFVSVWLEKLVDTRLELFQGSFQYQSFSDQWAGRATMPNGILAELRPNPSLEFEPLSRLPEYGIEYSPHRDDRYQHPCFGNTHPDHCREATPASTLSEGFHQLAPIVVQAGLMMPNEILAIENPEVHLHPKLQLDLAGFLIDQAKINKTVMIETHSDLIVRRVLRAILEEEIPQEAVRLYFTELHRVDSGYSYSTLKALETNYRGHIENWPDGFMDDEVREARRLLNIMYGTPDESKDDAEGD